MAIPAQTASLLKKVAIVDVVVGLALLAFGLSSGRVLPIGAIFVIMGIGVFAWARSQEVAPDGPVSGGPPSGSPISDA